MKKAIVLLLVLLPMWAHGQTDLLLSQQLFSRVNYNPAATGASNYMNMFLLARQQWVGFNDAPRTQVFNAHNYFENLRSGLGLSVSNDKLGYTNTINAKLAYAYHVHFKNKSYLSFGLGGGVLYRNMDMNRAIMENPNDPTTASYVGNPNEVSPDFDFGIEYNMKRWQIGASVTHLNNVVKAPWEINNLEANRHFYAYTKYSFDLDRNWKLVPTLMGINSEKTYNFEGNAMAYYSKANKERFWFGASYRTGDAFVSESIIGIVGLFITDFLRLGYSYDYNIGPVKPASSGTHEIMLSLRLSKGDSDYGRKTPRFFE